MTENKTSSEKKDLSCQKPQRDWSVYKRLLSYVRPFIWIFLVSIFGYLIYAGSQAGFVRIIEYVVDVIGEDQPNARFYIPLLMLFVVFFRGLGFFLGNYYIAVVARNVVHNLRCDLFNSLLRMPSKYYDSSSSGYLISRVTYNVEQVTGAATDAVKIIVREGFTVIVLLVYLFFLNWKLTLIFFAIGPLIVWIVNFANKRFRKISKRIQNSMGDVTHVTSEAITGYRVVRTFDGQQYEQDRFFKASLINLRQRLKMVVTSSISTPVIQLIVAAAFAILVFLALNPVIVNEITKGEFVSYIVAAALLAKPIRQLTEVTSTIQRGLAAAEDIFSQLDIEPEPDLGKFELSRVNGMIEFNQVSFRYDVNLDDVLRHISFKIDPGKNIALVGKSGSGKSTLVNLIPRFYNHSGGDILLDGRVLESYSLACLRKQIALVSQQVTLFNDTIANNIAYGGLSNASESDIIKAAEDAHAMEFIKDLPKGIHTLVGDNGVLLSGGQRQRIAIARAILKDAPILILDEATSALDTESERKIQSALETLMKNRTTIVIAHRLSTIEKADTILVMDKGQILEQGTHQELLDKNQHYANLHRLQFQYELAG